MEIQHGMRPVRPAPSGMAGTARANRQPLPALLTAHIPRCPSAARGRSLSQATHRSNARVPVSAPLETRR